MKSLNLEIPSDFINATDDSDDPIESAIFAYSNHPSIIKISENVTKSVFSFKSINLQDIENEIKNLESKKANTSNGIPTKDLKESSDIVGTYILDLINNVITNSTFDDHLKYADVIPIHKKDDATNKKNYRPVSVLPNISKNFERIMQKQICAHVDNFLSPFLCGYRKGYNSQHALLSLIERFRVACDNRGYGGAILMDLSKAFDTLDHKLLIAKLHAYGFDKTSLRLIYSYLTERWQRTKINTSFSSWSELLQGVPEGSILGPLLFNIFINDLFFIIKETDVCNYADDTTLYSCDVSLETLMTRLEKEGNEVIKWFGQSYMKLNEGKCHLLVSGHKYEMMFANLGGTKIFESCSETILGIELDSTLKFNHHVNNIYKKAGNKLNALSRQCKILPFFKRRLLLTSFFNSQFSFSPLIWMFHNRELNYKINQLHYRALRIIYRDNISSFNELLLRDGSFSIHIRNIQSLTIEMFKVFKGLAPSFMDNVFPIKYNSIATRANVVFYNPDNPKTSVYGQETLRELGPKIWNLLPDNFKELPTLNEFKLSIRKWSPSKCPCRLCKTYIPELGFID